MQNKHQLRFRIRLGDLRKLHFSLFPVHHYVRVHYASLTILYLNETKHEDTK